MTELQTFSASRLKTAHGCMRKYWWQHVYKHPYETHPAAVRGTAVHRTIQRLHEMYPNVDTNQAPQVYDGIYRNESELLGIQVDQKYYNEGLKMVLNYDVFRSIIIKNDSEGIPFSLPLQRQPIAMEVEFILPFPNEEFPLCIMHGYIDHVHEWGFVDLKTDRNRPQLGVLDNNLQFIIYDWAFAQLYNNVPRHRIWAHLKSGEDFESHCGGKLHLVIRQIERILEAQETGVYDMCVGDGCRICPFAAQCLGR